MKNIRLLFLGLIIPFNLNFSLEVKSAEDTCADYKYKGKQSKIEPSEKGLKIVTTAQASVLADDADLVDMALEEADASARIMIQQFIKTEIDSRKDFSDSSVQNITINPDGKEFDVEKTKTQLKEMSLAASGLQRGVVPLGSCYTPGKFVRVTVGVKPETVLAARNMGATMSGPFKGIDQSSDQAGNAVDGAGATAERMGSYNSMKGYSGLNEESEKIETDTSFEEANIAFREHRENDALSKINYYLSKNPNSKEGYLLRALISAWDFDDPKQALQDLTKAIEIDQNFAEAYAWRAEIFNYDFSNLKSAENDIQKALELSPNDPIVNFNASGVYQEKAYKNLEMEKYDNAYINFGKSNTYIKKSIDLYPYEINNMHKRIYPFGYLYLAYYYLGLNEYEIGWFFKDQKKSTSKGKPYFESAVNSLSLAIKLAPSIDETNKLLEDYDINEVNIGEIHYWRAETYASYLKGAWWKKPCIDWKISKKYGYKDSFKPVRKHCY